MKTAKIQYRGHCQCCGREQAVLRNGKMSKHGYTVDNGWFNGVCAGQHYDPIEISNHRALEIVAQVRADCEKIERRVEALKSGAEQPSHLSVYDFAARKSVSRPVAELSAREYKYAFDALINGLEGHARSGWSFANDLEAVAREWFLKPLREVELEDGPAPVEPGEKRCASGGNVVLTCRWVEGQRVHWERLSPDGQKLRGWTGIRAWRNFELV